MKNFKMSRNWLATGVVVALLAVSVPGFAWMGDWWCYGRGTGVGYSTLTAAQQEKISAVQEKYQPQLQKLQLRLNAKAAAVTAARADGSTTLAQMDALENELSQLESQYWTLLDQANAEAGQVLGTTVGQYFTCGYMGCNHRHNGGAGVPGPHRCCCWQ